MNTTDNMLSADINKSSSAEQVQTQDQSVTPVAQPKVSMREKIANLPDSIDTAIEEGKGNDVILETQSIIYTIITSIFSSCRMASLRLFMLTPEQRKNVSSSAYLIAIISAGCICVDLIFDFNFETILLALMFLVGAYFSDLLIQSAVLKEKHSKPAKKQKRTKSSTDDDIL